jgi:hypothetical protein
VAAPVQILIGDWAVRSVAYLYLRFRVAPYPPSVLISSRQACSQRRQASAQTRQCSCWPAWRSHSSPQERHTVAQACKTVQLMLAS